MAVIDKRTNSKGETSYRVRVRIKGHPPAVETFKRLTDAKRWATQTEAAIRERRYFKSAEAEKHTAAELIDRYIRDVLPQKKSGGVQRFQLDWWKKEIGAYTLAGITPALLTECRDKLAREPAQSRAKRPERAGPPRMRTPATVNRYLAAGSHAFSVAVREWQWLEDNPFSKVAKLKEPRGRVRFLSEDTTDQAGTLVEGERTRLLRACRQSKNRHLYPIVVLALSTGMREGEILGLTWDRVDLERGVLFLEETKNGERRRVALAGHALEVLKEHAKVRALNTDLVFPGSRRRRQGEAEPPPPRPVDIRAPWNAALEKAGIEDFRFHDLRHSAASYLAMNGASPAEIAEVLGHKTLQMVKRYAHLSDSHTAGVVARMNARIFGEG